MFFHLDQNATMQMEYQMQIRIGVHMKTKLMLSKFFLLVGMVLYFTGCAQSKGPCTIQPYANLSEADKFAYDDTLPFRFPMDDADP